MDKEQETDHIYTKTDTDQILKRVSFLMVLALATGAIIVMARFPGLNKKTLGPTSKEKITAFSSLDEVTAYIQESQQLGSFGGLGAGRGVVTMEAAPQALDNAAVSKMAPTAATPSRVSDTNVQVAGIDEPDIVKTDGQRIFFAQDQLFYRFRESIGSMMPQIGIEDKIVPPSTEDQAKTQVINAFPLDTLGIASSIPKNGQLLLSGETLVVFGNEAIYGYDVHDAKNPTEKWKLELENSYVATSRLLNGKLYIVTQTTLNQGNPCPMPLLKTSLQTITIPCTQIYHPNSIVPVDSTYSVVEVNPTTGAVGNKISFLGSTSQSVVYVSPNALYLTYTKQNDLAKLYYQFFSEDGSSLLPPLLVQKIRVLETYDISPQSKLNEIQLILAQHQMSLTRDDQLKFQQELENRLNSFTSKHVREIEETIIVKVPLSTLTLGETGSVAGRPLNQFSLDEYLGDLRIATTASGGWFGSTQSISDLYVLDDNLKVIGSVQNMGKGERIYSTRFIEDKGYIVTFKQVDPFYVVDLRDPKNPQLKGELKIPGYSAYLHPIDKNTIIGVGKEDQYVKLSLFDVTSPELPNELSKFTMNEFWSEALDNHHAFLLDPKHQVFFIPGSQGGYVFSYKNHELKLEKAVNSPTVKRALFIEDYLYVIGTGKLTVLDETTWNTVKELEL